MGREAGITEAQLLEFGRFKDSQSFSYREKLVLRLAVALTITPASVDDELFVALRSEFTEKQLVELGAAIGWENHRARFNRAFNVLSEGFCKSAFCPLPERGQD